MSDPKFVRHPSVPLRDCQFTENQYFWFQRINQHSFSKVDLVDAAGLYVSSNNSGVVPNEDVVFKGKTGSEQKRTIEFYGLSPGGAFIDVRRGGPAGEFLFNLQVRVEALPGDKPSFVVFDADSAALNASKTPVTYKLKHTTTITGGPPENLFNSVPEGTKHVAISCHGEMKGQPAEAIMYIGGNITRANCFDVFGKLNPKCKGGVIWIGGCVVGADNEFCKKAVQASGCYLVAPLITLPPLKVPGGMIEFFRGSMPKYFNMKDGAPMNAAEFLMKQKELKFRVTKGQ